MLDLNTLRKIQALGPNYMADPGQLDMPGDLTSNPLDNLSPQPQQNPLAGLMARAQQQPIGGQISTVPQQLPVPSAPQPTYDNSPIAGLMQPPQTSAVIPQQRVPDTTAATGGLMPNAGGFSMRMPPPKPFPTQYGGNNDVSSSGAGGTGTPNIDPGALRGLMPDAATAGFEQLMSPESTPIYNKYRDLLMQGPPNPDNYKPSKLRMAMAALSGLGGNPAVTNYVENLPEEKAKADYEQRLKDFQTGTTEEEKMVSNKRGILTAQAMDQIRGREADLKGQQYQFGIDKLNAEMQMKTKQFEETQQRLYQQMAQQEGNFQAQLKIREMIAENEKNYRDTLNRVRETENNIRNAREKAYEDNIASLKAERDATEANRKRRTDIYERYIDDLSHGRSTDKYYRDANGDLQMHETTVVGPRAGAGGHTREEAVEWLRTHGAKDPNDEAAINKLLQNPNWPK